MANLGLQVKLSVLQLELLLLQLRLLALRTELLGLQLELFGLREALFTLRLELFALREVLLELRERFCLTTLHHVIKPTNVNPFSVVAYVDCHSQTRIHQDERVRHRDVDYA
jgi:hypothetical protein